MNKMSTAGSVRSTSQTKDLMGDDYSDYSVEGTGNERALKY
jgi:hypothetical protein